jgi:hypothetical protein
MRGHPESNGPRASPRYLANSLLPSNKSLHYFPSSPCPANFCDCTTRAIKKQGPQKPQSNIYGNVSEPAKELLGATGYWRAGRGEILAAFCLIGGKLKKRRFPLARSERLRQRGEGRFRKHFPVSDRPRSALRQKTKASDSRPENNSPPRLSSFLSLIFFSSFKHVAIRHNATLPNGNNALLFNSDITLFWCIIEKWNR